MKNIMINSMPHTEEGAKLHLSKEIADNCKVVYRLNAVKNGAHFVELWNPDIDYDVNHIILPLQSTFAGISDEYGKGTNFANVIHSSTDNCPGGGSWIQFLKIKLNPGKVINYDCSTCCAETNVIYQADSNDKKVVTSPSGKMFNCTVGGTIKGGHIVMDIKNATEVAKGGNVELLPICSAHNSFNNTGEQYASGQGYYMKLARPMRTVMLKNYLVVTSETLNEIADLISGE